jgi:thymidine phosphorylase
VVTAPSAGFVHAIDSRRLARVAKLLGAPADAAAGLELHVRLGDRVETGAPLFSLHAQTRGEMNYAKAYLALHEFLTLGEAS